MFRLAIKNKFELLLFIIMVALLAQQTWSGLQLNAKYMFTVDLDGTIVVMNTQNGSMARCDHEFTCGPWRSIVEKQ
jgi:hypothetical protein